MNGGLSPWIPHKIYMEIHAEIKTARRKIAGTKQFTKAKSTLSRSGSGQVPQSGTDPK